MGGGNGAAVLACSPRAGGNTDAAATVLSRELGGAVVTRLRGYQVLPCESCGGCAVAPEHCCPLQRRDTSLPLFSLLEQADTLVLVSPIYFYHVPAQLKAFMDRSQPWWRAWGQSRPCLKTAYPVLIAAREQGENLFAGAILSLRCWLRLFGYTLGEPLTLRGLDGPGALADSATANDALAGYAEMIRRKEGAGDSPCRLI